MKEAERLDFEAPGGVRTAVATDSEPPPGPGSARRRRKLSAIMMADVSNFSRMMGSDEHATIDLIQDFHKRVIGLVERFEGRVVDTAGDSVFGEFDSVVNAMSCACLIQKEQAAANAGRGPGQRVESRIGVHLGDVIIEDYRVYGDGVNIAARLEPLAEPGGICISEAVYDQVRSKLELEVEHLGLKELKNIEHPIRLYRVAPVAAAGQRMPVAVERSAPATKIVGEQTAPRLVDDMIRPSVLVLSSIAAFLLASPFLLFPTGGVLPLGGAIVLGIAAGRVWARRSGRRSRLLVTLGAALASGALWTDWSRVTNGLFVLAGLIVAAVGVGRRRD